MIKNSPVQLPLQLPNRFYNKPYTCKVFSPDNEQVTNQTIQIIRTLILTSLKAKAVLDSLDFQDYFLIK